MLASSEPGGVAAGVAAGGALYAWACYELGPEAPARLLTAYGVAIPCFVAYKRVQWELERIPELLGRPIDERAADAAYEALHAEWAPRALAVVLELRGFNFKTGQMVASSFGGVFPATWVKLFEPLLDSVPAQPFPVVRATIERELGRPLSAVFSSFDEAPLAAASIGQVHRATLRDGGARVVVKVQYPEVEGQFRGDVFAAKRFAAVALPEHVKPLDEIEKQFATEFHYDREAANLALIRGNLARGGFAHIIVPAPYPALCTKSVLVMEEVPHASKLTTELGRDMAFIAAARGVPVAALLESEAALNADALARGELRCGPSAADMAALQARLGWLNFFRAAGGLSPVHVPLNHAALVDELLRVHGHEVLVDGAFNGDPHPGNVLVSRARPGAPVRLALVDYGQVKVLTRAQRLQAARLVVALARARADDPAHRAAVAALVRDMGMTTARNDPGVLFELARLFFDRDDKLVTRGKNTQAFIEDLNARDASADVPEAFVLVARASLMLRGLGHQLNQHRSAAHAWAPIAERVLRDAGEDPDRVLPAA